ncbi:unnamed protein product [Vitrella brassicaformis CCMP3155]|uniref:Uncharacterized protein n=1 Tax=Vitrella brassicaformis (strain CCMP3155) TaxID=1169540 RepID=A0A0G4FB61_VITBC|nr:unnamed protein product [Vitrella brassicaformis CCMP3155]|eukprot:CEM10178.1 unnamed protein product [Vitrella brassicaformis CCMP3155]
MRGQRGCLPPSRRPSSSGRRSSQRSTAAGRRSRRPPWDDSISDMNRYRLPEEVLRHRRQMAVSSHEATARFAYRHHIEEIRRGSMAPIIKQVRDYTPPPTRSIFTEALGQDNNNDINTHRHFTRTANHVNLPPARLRGSRGRMTASSGDADSVDETDLEAEVEIFRSVREELSSLVGATVSDADTSFEAYQRQGSPPKAPEPLSESLVKAQLHQQGGGEGEGVDADADAGAGCEKGDAVVGESMGGLGAIRKESPDDKVGVEKTDVAPADRRADSQPPTRPPLARKRPPLPPQHRKTAPAAGKQGEAVHVIPSAPLVMESFCREQEESIAGEEGGKAACVEECVAGEQDGGEGATVANGADDADDPAPNGTTASPLEGLSSPSPVKTTRHAPTPIQRDIVGRSVRIIPSDTTTDTMASEGERAAKAGKDKPLEMSASGKAEEVTKGALGGEGGGGNTMLVDRRGQDVLAGRKALQRPKAYSPEESPLTPPRRHSRTGLESAALVHNRAQSPPSPSVQPRRPPAPHPDPQQPSPPNPHKQDSFLAYLRNETLFESTPPSPPRSMKPDFEILADRYPYNSNVSRAASAANSEEGRGGWNGVSDGVPFPIVRGDFGTVSCVGKELLHTKPRTTERPGGCVYRDDIGVGLAEGPKRRRAPMRFTPATQMHK